MGQTVLGGNNVSLPGYIESESVHHTQVRRKRGPRTQVFFGEIHRGYYWKGGITPVWEYESYMGCILNKHPIHNKSEQDD